MAQEQDIADMEMFAVDSRWGVRGHSAGRRHTVVGNGEETGLGVAEPSQEGCVKWRER